MRLQRFALLGIKNAVLVEIVLLESDGLTPRLRFFDDVSGQLLCISGDTRNREAGT